MSRKQIKNYAKSKSSCASQRAGPEAYRKQDEQTENCTFHLLREREQRGSEQREREQALSPDTKRRGSQRRELDTLALLIFVRAKNLCSLWAPLKTRIFNRVPIRALPKTQFRAYSHPWLHGTVAVHGSQIFCPFSQSKCHLHPLLILRFCKNLVNRGALMCAKTAFRTEEGNFSLYKSLSYFPQTRRHRRCRPACRCQANGRGYIQHGLHAPS